MNAQTEKYFEPVRQLNALAVENVEKLLDIQLKSINETTRLAIQQMKSAAQVSDVEGLKKHFSTPTEVAKAVCELFVKDAQAAIEIGKRYSEEAQGVITNALNPGAAGEAASAPKNGAKAAPKAKQTQSNA